MKRVAAPLAAALLASVLTLFGAGCGGSGAEPGASNGATSATLVLDFQPNAVHSGIYAAEGEGFYRNAGVKMTIRAPSASTDAPKLLESGRAQFAVMDIHDLGIAAEKGFKVVGLMPIVQRPLASVLTNPTVARPRDLEGKTVGVTGLPSDDAVLDSVVSADGGDPAKVHRVTIGFNAVASLAAGKVDGATAFWNVEGVALQAQGIPVHEFRVDDYGAPRYPELVLCTSQTLIDDKPDLVDAVIKATTEGYTEAVERPGDALAQLKNAVPGADPGELSLQKQALDHAHAFEPPGRFDRGVLDAWASWDVEHGILSRPPDIDRTFDLGQ
jgi:NitT/TauT family transport system substrate-binding protein/putative hydroxymethylpyrimidine transport system substrate-binding protein